MEAVPIVPVTIKSEPISSHNEPQERIVVPLSKHIEPQLSAVADGFFPESKVRELVAQVRPEDVEKIITRNLVPSEKKPVVLEEQSSTIVEQDVRERVTDRTSLYVATQSKLELARFIKESMVNEANSPYGQRRSDTDKAVLDSMTAEIDNRIGTLTNLSQQFLEIQTDPLVDAQNIQIQKQMLLANSHLIAGIGESTERVSPQMGNIGEFHTGPLQSVLRNNAGFLNERGPGVYNRENAGTMAHLLSLNIAREYRLPEKNPTARRQVEVFGSGMAALGTVLEAVESSNSELIITEGFYFELPEIAKRHKVITETTPIDDKLYFGLAEKLKVDSTKPLTIIAQPYGSGLEPNIFDLKRTLGIIKSAEGNRPVTLILDSTMHGASINEWQTVQEITGMGKNFTLIEIQSLVKHGQLGMDSVPGGVALALGSHPELVRTSTGSRGTMMPEHAASVLFPVNAETQMIRIQRAGRNAEYIANHLRSRLQNNPIFERVHYAPSSDPETAKQYKTKPPILFIEINPLVPSHEMSVLMTEFSAIHKMFPESGKGTSYGFDGTRFEIIPIGRDQSPTIRIAAGQESTLQLMAIANFIETKMNNPNFIKNVSFAIKQEISSIQERWGYSKENFKSRLYFDPSSDENNDTDTSIEDMRSQEVQMYLQDQCRGYQISQELTENKKLRESLGIEEKQLADLNKSLDSPQEIRSWVTELTITKPVFLKELRNKLSVAGKSPSLERVYQIAKAINNNKGVAIVLGPVAKIANDILKKMQPDIERQLGAKLPFNF